MSRLVVITTPELAPGYRLAGVATVPVGSSEEAAGKLRELIEVRRERGVIALHEPYHKVLDRDLRREIDELRAPLVVPLPAGEGGEDVARWRERLLRMLWQAVGYEMTFGTQRGSK
ncbi:MAG TPA: V-type ATP synthase subunit F [Rubrobacteraceae bacterium]|nr:V-type ATP synthase subunit F [Rubrobacteraceae bacterium]